MERSLGGKIELASRRMSDEQGRSAPRFVVRKADNLLMVRSRRLELPRPFGHSDLNAARLPIRHDRTHETAGLEGRRWQAGASSSRHGEPQRLWTTRQ